MKTCVRITLMAVVVVLVVVAIFFTMRIEVIALIRHPLGKREPMEETLLDRNVAYEEVTVVTEDGLRLNIRVGVQYMEAWLGGNGCVPLYNLMEDAATAEISRTQVWQWLHNASRLADGRAVTLELFRQVFDEEMDRIRQEVGEQRFAAGHFDLAARLFREIIEHDELEEFLTLKAYEQLD